MSVRTVLQRRAGFLVALAVVTVSSALLRILRITVPAERVFDEVYSPAFAWKLLRGEAFFDVHPILAEVQHLPGLLLFGDTPLGWRFSPWLWGSVFLLGVGAFGSLLTGRRLVGVLATMLAALDVSFFVYGRTGLPDMFLLSTFVWAMALFFLSCRSPSRRIAQLSLLGSGVLLGNLVATKWFGMGALVLVWAWIVLAATETWRRGSRAWSTPRVHPWFLAIALLIVPLVTYLLWLVPLVGVPGKLPARAGEEIFLLPCALRTSGEQVPALPATWLGRVRHWHCLVWNYHVHLDATHPYASPWWSWPMLRHPVLFYLDPTNPVRRISATGNPVLWWTAFATVFLTPLSLLTRWRRVKGRGPKSAGDAPGGSPIEPQQRGRQQGDRAMRSDGGLARQDPPLVEAWLLLGIFGFWLPWAFIQRVTFQYHYFLSFTLSLVLLSLWLARFLDHPRGRTVVSVFLLLALGLFMVLYPAATALPVPWMR